MSDLIRVSDAFAAAIREAARDAGISIVKFSESALLRTIQNLAASTDAPAVNTDATAVNTDARQERIFRSGVKSIEMSLTARLARGESLEKIKEEVPVKLVQWAKKHRATSKTVKKLQLVAQREIGQASAAIPED
jgi:hypothetical protein